MKKIIAVLTLLLLANMTAYAESTEVGSIYSTDILAYVNEKPIDAYNIGGRTVIIAEDLNRYGYNVWYDENERHLAITSYFTKTAYEIADIPRGIPGQILGKIYSTDISVTYNDIPLTGYNIGGRTAICIEDIGEITDSPHKAYGFSKYLANYVWSAKERTISLNSYISNNHEITERNLSRAEYSLSDNVLTVIPNDNENAARITSSSFSDDFDKYSLSPLYLEADGIRHEIGVAVSLPKSGVDPLYMHINDPKQVLEIAKSMRTPMLAHDEGIEQLTKKYTLKDKIENSQYTVLQLLDEEKNNLIYALKKSGGCLKLGEYSGSYSSVSIMFDDEEHELIVQTYPETDPHGKTVTCNNHYQLNEYSFN